MARQSHAELTPETEARPRPYRHKIRNLTYVEVDGNRGLLRDLSEFGMASQTLTPVQIDQPVRLSLELRDPRVRVEAQGRVAWTDGRGLSGVEFVDLPRSSQRSLQEWIFSRLLAAAYRAMGDENAALLFSSIGRPAIRLKPQIVPPNLSLNLAGITVRARSLARALDGLVLLCAVLLFSVLTLALTDVLPSWPMASAFVMGAACVLVLAYWGLFEFFFGATPGERLAEVACRESAKGKRETELRTRFR